MHHHVRTQLERLLVQDGGEDVVHHHQRPRGMGEVGHGAQIHHVQHRIGRGLQQHEIGARRGDDASWIPAFSPDELVQQVQDNLRNLRLDVIDAVNLRSMYGIHGPAEGPLEPQLTALAELQRKGLVRHIGLSNVTPKQIADARKICEIVCVQNFYNVAHRADDALIDDLARDRIAYVPFFPLGGFTPLQSSTLSDVAKRLGATPMQVALAWLLQRAPNILLIPGTSSVAHLKENLAAAELKLPDDAVAALNGIAASAAA